MYETKRPTAQGTSCRSKKVRGSKNRTLMLEREQLKSVCDIEEEESA